MAVIWRYDGSEKALFLSGSYVILFKRRGVLTCIEPIADILLETNDAVSPA
jgi:hypothetical protein